MRPQWDNQIIQFTAAIALIRTAMALLPPTFTTAQGTTVSVEEFALSLDELKAALQVVNDRIDHDPVILGIHQTGILGCIQNIASHASALSSNPTVAVMDQIAQQTWGIRASLVWLMPRTAGVASVQEIITDFDLDAKLALLKSLTIQYTESEKKLAGSLQDAVSKLVIINSSVDQLKSYEREASNAKTNAEASSAVAATHKDILAIQIVELTTSTERQKLLLNEIEKLKETAVSTLESTSKVALAASFSTRKNRLSREQIGWQISFVIGIAGLLLVGHSTVGGSLSLPPLFSENHIDFGALFARIALISPIVWFTWFAARQLGMTNRLIEDYAFKEASALAFVGYQREMKDDVEMIKLLRESAIHNFGNQPTRIFDKAEPVSPMHELLGKAFEKGGVDKLLDLIKAIRADK